MSIHPSLRGVDTLVGERSVFTRMERIQILLRDGKFDRDASSPHGLPKVRTRSKVAKKKVAKAEGEAAPAAAVAPAPKTEEKKKKK
ncbi:MAG TPA: small basic protein [Planctomycetota bacterium]|nr:small basic protein [Planctomycetota bacterium]